MGLPFSRVLKYKMPKRKSSKSKQHSRTTCLPTAPSKVKSVHNLCKTSNVSRHSRSRSHTNLATGLQTEESRRIPRDVSRVGGCSDSTSQVPYAYVYAHPDQYGSKNDLSEGGSTIPSQYLRSEDVSSSASRFPTRTNTRVLVIDDVYNNISSTKSKFDISKPLVDSDGVSVIEKISVNFEDMVAFQAIFVQIEATQEKAKKFVKAWRTALSYPKTKKGQILTDIPLAATSHCKTGIAMCSRCYRRHVKRRISRFSTDNLLLADLVHQESLEKFIEETEKFHATSSIFIKEDLQQKQLFETVRHADSANRVPKEDDNDTSISDDDMKLTVRFNVPPPVHIDYVPEENLFQKDVQKLADLGLVTGKKSSEINKALEKKSHLKIPKVKGFKKSKSLFTPD